MPSFRTKNAALDWSEHDQPRSRQFGDIYHSSAGEIGESEYVFIDGNHLDERWAKLPATDSCFTIGETGFGSGLNFLLTWARWQSLRQTAGQNNETSGSDSKRARLHYVAFEKYPIRLLELERIHGRWPQLAELSHRLRSTYPDHSRGCHRIHLDESVTLDLWIGDAQELLAGFMQSASGRVNAWYLHGFSPGLNPELWSSELCRLIAAHSTTDATLSTYTVAGKVRRNLEHAGFTVSKQAGFGNKRHMLTACRQSNAGATPSRPGSWFSLPDPLNSPAQALVIGAGLAGCSLAYSLARRGWQVNVLESQDHVLAGASGVRQLALRCRLFSQYTAEAEFFLQSYLFASRQFKQLSSVSACGWHESGVIQLQQALNKQRKPELQRWLDLYPTEVLQQLSDSQCEQLIGTQVSNKALLFPGGGWVDSAQLVGRYLQHDNIKVHNQCEVSKLERHGTRWIVFDSKGKEIGCSETVILANGSGASEIEQLSGFPIEALRGQTSQVDSNPVSKNIAAVICGQRSVFPSLNGQHTLAASYSNEARNLDGSVDDDRENLEGARSCFANPEFLSNKVISGDIALRCNMPDRLPLIGMVPDSTAMIQIYSDLARNARASITDSGSYLPGLYLSVAHGSNGLATCPFASEYLASLICGEPLPVSEAVGKLINPARFIIRDLKRQKTQHTS